MANDTSFLGGLVRTAIGEYSSDDFENTDTDAHLSLEERMKKRLMELEEFRQQQLKIYQSRKTKLLFAAPIFAVVLALIFIKTKQPDLAFTLAVFFGGPAYYWFQLPKKAYMVSYKSKIIPIMLARLGAFDYQAIYRSSLNDYSHFQTMPNYDAWHMEDYISGKIDDVGLEFFELKLTKKRQSRGKSSENIVFKGSATCLTLPFEFMAHTVVKKDATFLGNLISLKSGKETVRLENVAFEKRYEVLSTDQQEARYILSPAMMERLMLLEDSFQQKAKGRGLVCEFVGNKAFFMMSYTGNLMEAADIYKPADNMDAIRDLGQELELIISIVKQLKLDYMAQRKNAYNNLGVTPE